MSQQITTNQKKLIGWSKLKERIGELSKSTVWRMERDGAFPKRITISGNRVAWDSDEIDEWIKSVISRRGKKE